jgi:hypothetical protein
MLGGQVERRAAGKVIPEDFGVGAAGVCAERRRGRAQQHRATIRHASHRSLLVSLHAAAPVSSASRASSSSMRFLQLGSRRKITDSAATRDCRFAG